MKGFKNIDAAIAAYKAAGFGKPEREIVAMFIEQWGKDFVSQMDSIELQVNLILSNCYTFDMVEDYKKKRYDIPSDSFVYNPMRLKISLFHALKK